jgi:hypothetical protein
VEDGDFGLLVRNAFDSQWSDVIRMAVAHARPRERATLLTDLAKSAEETSGAAGTRIRLLALAALEHATELDPHVRAAVERNAASLIPPRTTEEARTLADAGPLVLELLPGPEGLTDDEARAVVITASLIGTDAALPVLSRFRSHPSLLVRAQLAWTAHRFDTRRYAADVIAHLPPDDLYFCAHSVDQLRALRDLGGRPLVQVIGDIDSDDIREGLLPGQLSKLVVSGNRVLRDLRFLSDQGQLAHLDISGGSPYVHDLTPLAELPLKWLLLAGLPGLENPDALVPLSASRTLRLLDIGIPLHGDSLDEVLPRNLPLTYLRFTRNALQHTGLRGFGHMHSLKQLSLASLPEKLTPEDFEEITRLPALQELRVNWNAVGWSAGPVLPNVTRLRLNTFTGNEDLSNVAALFPGLRRVTFHLAPDVTDVPEHLLAFLPDTAAVTIEKTDSVV